MAADLCLETRRQDCFGNEEHPGRRNSLQKPFQGPIKDEFKKPDINHINKQVKIKYYLGKVIKKTWY